MKSYTTLRNLFGKEVNRSDSTTLSLGDEWINDGVREILGMPENWKFLEKTITATTTSGTASYFLPYDYDELLSVKITVGSLDYTPIQVTNRDEWSELNSISYQSDFVTHFYILDRRIEFYPIPATTSNVITYTYKKRIVDLSEADYTTGTVAVTNNSTTVTGTGTTFTAAMVGRYIRVGGTGDRYWYRIASFTNATTIAIEVPYTGLTVTGQAYIIGQMSPLPENHDKAPVYYAVAQYWYQNNDGSRGDRYLKKFEQQKQMIVEDNINKTMELGLSDELSIRNPNWYPRSLS